jgi:ATP-dependent Clp protease adaptor protein ClpS
MAKEKIKTVSDGTDTKEGKHSLILLNDDVHTFEYVIRALVEVCSHDPAQAEQCTLIAHYKGKCEVSTGGMDKLRAQRRDLTERGLKTYIN